MRRPRMDYRFVLAATDVQYSYALFLSYFQGGGGAHQILIDFDRIMHSEK